MLSLWALIRLRGSIITHIDVTPLAHTYILKMEESGMQAWANVGKTVDRTLLTELMQEHIGALVIAPISVDHNYQLDWRTPDQRP